MFSLFIRYPDAKTMLTPLLSLSSMESHVRVSDEFVQLATVIRTVVVALTRLRAG